MDSVSGLQKQLDVLSQKVNAIIQELGKECKYEPEKYSLVDKEEEEDNGPSTDE